MYISFVNHCASTWHIFWRFFAVKISLPSLTCQARIKSRWCEPFFRSVVWVVLIAFPPAQGKEVPTPSRGYYVVSDDEASIGEGHGARGLPGCSDQIRSLSKIRQNVDLMWNGVNAVSSAIRIRNTIYICYSSGTRTDRTLSS